VREEATGMRRKAILRRAEVPLPQEWEAMVTFGSSLGLSIRAVATGTLMGGGVFTGDSPGDTLYLRGVSHIEQTATARGSVLHEIAHFIVAKNRNKLHRENFGSTDDEEILTCAVQITWLLSQGDVRAAIAVSRYVNMQSSNHGSLEESLALGLAELNRVGLNLPPLETKCLAEFVLLWGCRSERSAWNDVSWHLPHSLEASLPKIW